MTSTILGGRIYATDGTEGDALYRARWYSKAFGSSVVVNDRLAPEDIAPRKRTYLLGLPKALDPKDYVVRAAERGRQLAKVVEELKP